MYASNIPKLFYNEKELSNVNLENEHKKTYISNDHLSESELSYQNDEDYTSDILTCMFCDYKTTRNSNLKRHINTCKNRKNEEAKYRLLYEKNEAEMQGLIELYEEAADPSLKDLKDWQFKISKNHWQS